jgi:hypothetical protein
MRRKQGSNKEFHSSVTPGKKGRATRAGPCNHETGRHDATEARIVVSTAKSSSAGKSAQLSSQICGNARSEFESWMVPVRKEFASDEHGNPRTKEQVWTLDSDQQYRSAARQCEQCSQALTGWVSISIIDRPGCNAAACAKSANKHY